MEKVIIDRRRQSMKVFFHQYQFMKLSEFKRMNAQQQVMLYADGITVGRFQTNGIIAECRQVDDFYVECEIHIHNNCNCVMYCHRNTALLDKYFNQLPPITIDEILYQ
ncbi:MAG: hypothetical protein EOO13_01205 [Chitinophagaceae bacterium]|nr:MAG: hypothetical protein EOO13_01205 [Chitinophagaceae bacterium]